MIDRNKCINCGECTKRCWSSALNITVREADRAEITATVIRDKLFYKEDGGLTISGGEPLLQAGFAAELLKAAKENNIHTTVDTAGNVPFDSFEKVLSYTDLFLYDIKCINEELHIKNTGVSNALILENLKKLVDQKANVIVRIPVISGHGSSEDMKSIAVFLSGFKETIKVELIPYHNLGAGKYESLGLEYMAKDLEVPDQKYITEQASCLRDHGITVSIG